MIMEQMSDKIKKKKESLIKMDGSELRPNRRRGDNMNIFKVK